MNLYLRFLGFIFSAFFIKGKKELRKTQVKFRVLPQDCDINFHLTNSRYLAFADLARMYATVRMGLLKAVLKNKWMIVVQSQEITYIRPIPPFATFTLTTEFIHYDEKYFYAYHEYLYKGSVMATAMVRGAFLKGKKVVGLGDILSAEGFELPVWEEPDSVSSWKDHLAVKKATNS